MDPKNDGLEDDVPFQTYDFQVPCYFSRCVKEVISLGFLPPGLHLHQEICLPDGDLQPDPTVTWAVTSAIRMMGWV